MVNNDQTRQDQTRKLYFLSEHSGLFSSLLRIYQVHLHLSFLEDPKKTLLQLSYKSLLHTLLREISFQSAVNVAALALLTSSQTGLKVKAAAAAAGQPLLGEAG